MLLVSPLRQELKNVRKERALIKKNFIFPGFGK
jgi:hypothetical protein